MTSVVENSWWMYSNPREHSIKPERIEDVYLFGNTLGSGQWGTTFECQEMATRKMACCKVISKLNLISEEDKQDVRREIAIMHHMAGSENVVDIYGVYEDECSVYIVMELCRGDLYYTTLYNMERNGGTPYSEKDAAHLVKTMMKAVEQCHVMGVIHRDLKPQNFLFTSDGTVLKITDFGLSTFFEPGEGFDRYCGSPMYMAPEMLKWAPGAWNQSRKPPKYGPEVDVWSAGVMVHVLLCGCLPFDTKTNSILDIHTAISEGKLRISSSISKPARDLVERMLQPNPEQRPTAHKVLRHPWINELGVAPDSPLDPVVASRLQQFSSMCKLKRVVSEVIVSSLRREEIYGLTEWFKTLDVDGNKVISIEELEAGLKKFGSGVTLTELNRIMNETDIDKNGVIECTEFLAATLHTSKVGKLENLNRAFRKIDKDGSGFITEDELLIECHRLNMNERDVAEMIAEADSDKNGDIDYNEFVNLMRRKDDR